LCRIGKPLFRMIPESLLNLALALPCRHSEEITEIFVVDEIDALL
jgi:hypothetical protein